MCLTCIRLSAQQGISLDTISVQDSIQSPFSSGFSFKDDSLQLSERNAFSSAAEYLAENTSVFIKSNGPGLITTPTYRGGDASSTSVLWNGMRLNSPMLGGVDFSLIPMDVFSSIELMSGTSTNLYATGGLGGGINLGTKPNFTNNIYKVDLMGGSFKRFGYSGYVNQRINVTSTPVVLSVSSNMMINQNEFEYVNIYSEPFKTEVMKDAQLRNRNTTISLSTILKGKLLLTANYWSTRTSRSLPLPININNGGSAIQNDSSDRLMLNAVWNPFDSLQISQTFFYEKNINYYKDQSNLIENSNDFYSVQSMTLLQWVISENIQVSGQVLNAWTEARSGNYNGFQNEFYNETSARVDWRPFGYRLLFEGGARLSLRQGLQKVTPNAGISYRLLKQVPLSMFLSAGQSVRFPTLNERFWQPGGSSLLKPEFGNTVEGGLKFLKKRIEFEAVAFWGKYSDRIRWISTGTVATPTNIHESLVKGVEIRAKKIHKIASFKLVAYVNASFTQSEGRRAGEADYSALTFIPKWNGNAGLTTHYRLFSFGYHHQYIGQRFISSDETAYMPAYDIARIQASVSPKRWPITINVFVDNLYNVDYQNMPWRPMPGRSINALIRLKWVK